PPMHAKYRAPLNKAFSPKTMLAMQDDIRTLAAELIDKVRLQGHCDFAAEVAEPLPVTIFMKVMGLPLENLALYRDWCNRLLISNETADKMQVINQVVAAMSEIVKQRMEK